MSSPRNPGIVLPVAVTLTVLLGSYVGAYYAMVQPQRVFWISNGQCAIVPAFPRLATKLRARHRWEIFFSPVHWLDRCIRPHVWEPTP